VKSPVADKSSTKSASFWLGSAAGVAAAETGALGIEAGAVDDPVLVRVLLGAYNHEGEAVIGLKRHKLAQASSFGATPEVRSHRVLPGGQFGKKLRNPMWKNCPTSSLSLNFSGVIQFLLCPPNSLNKSWISLVFSSDGTILLLGGTACRHGPP
jgi:hypothetical protein